MTLSGDNIPALALDIKSEEIDSPASFCCRGSGDFMDSCKPTATPSFERQQSPSPSLDDVPQAYIIDQLRILASNYWNKPETTDCTIIIPIPHAQGRLFQPIHPLIAAHLPPHTLSTVSSMYDPSGLGRRATVPTFNFTPRMTLKLHLGYLSPHSSYIRALLSGANPLDLINSTPTDEGFKHFNVPPNRLPRLLPGSADHPTLLLPVPDPSSFYLLVHWMYFGNTRLIRQYLNDNIIQWEGVALNVEYLGLSSGIREFLKRWWCSTPAERAAMESDTESDSESDSDTECSDSDSVSDMELDGLTVSVMDGSDVESDDEKEPFRGRPRIRRPLSYQEPGTRPWY
ncbi:hypothetical protein DXG03_000847 [Asterophora parasitica]|uniref:Uncharacterized protein n=1 Tax=Asterophora parasitica TaxID=117018 RepID=A0A9P7KFA8_9AGAR|nr:hypothetical protein DXG03_000847 [Asterophora parasitica]